MGWFLTRKKAKSSKSGWSAEAWDRARTMQGLKWLASAAILIGLIAGWKYGQPELIGYVGTRGLPIAAERVEIVDCPAWLHGDVQRDLRWLVAGHVVADPMDHGGLSNAVIALSGNAWVESVSRIERTATGLKVFAKFREPAALVMLPRKRDHADDYLRRTDRFYVVDVKGYRLPTDSLGLRDEPYKFDQLKSIGLPVMVGVGAAAPKAGQLWQGEDVQSGLALAKLLEREPYVNQIVAYDLSGRNRRKQVWLSLRTKTNGIVWWGLAPGQEKTVEPDAKVKMQWLSQISQMKGYRGAIDMGGKVVALYSEAPAVIQPGDESDPRLSGSLLPGDAIHPARYDHR